MSLADNEIIQEKEISPLYTLVAVRAMLVRAFRTDVPSRLVFSAVSYDATANLWVDRGSANGELGSLLTWQGEWSTLPMPFLLRPGMRLHVGVSNGARVFVRYSEYLSWDGKADDLVRFTP